MCDYSLVNTVVAMVVVNVVLVGGPLLMQWCEWRRNDRRNT